MKTNKVNACESIAFFRILFLFFLNAMINRNKATNCLNLMFILVEFSFMYLPVCMFIVISMDYVVILALRDFSFQLVLYLENNYFVNCVDASGAGICLFWNRAQLSDQRSQHTQTHAYMFLSSFSCVVSLQWDNNSNRNVDGVENQIFSCE